MSRHCFIATHRGEIRSIALQAFLRITEHWAVASLFTSRETSTPSTQHVHLRAVKNAILRFVVGFCKLTNQHVQPRFTQWPPESAAVKEHLPMGCARQALVHTEVAHVEWSLSRDMARKLVGQRGSVHGQPCADPTASPL